MASRPFLSTARWLRLSAGSTLALSRHQRRLKIVLRLIMRTQEVIKRRTLFIRFPRMSKPLPVRAARGMNVSLFSFFIPCSSLTDFLCVIRLVALSKCFHGEQADPPPLGPPPPSKTDTQLPPPKVTQHSKNVHNKACRRKSTFRSRLFNQGLRRLLPPSHHTAPAGRHGELAPTASCN